MADEKSDGVTVKGLSVKEITVGAGLILALLGGGAGVYSVSNVKAEIGNVVKTDIVKTVENVVRDVVRTETVISPQPLSVEFQKKFVEKDEFNEFLRQYRDDIRRIEGRVTEDLREASAIRQSISGQIGEMRGELRQISLSITALQKRE